VGIDEIAAGRELPDFLREELAEGDDDAEIWGEFFEGSDGFGVADVLGSKKGELLSQCDCGNRRGREFSAAASGTVGLGNDADDFVRPGDQPFEGRGGDLGGAEEYDAQGIHSRGLFMFDLFG
jgi:hypothetical protein